MTYTNTYEVIGSGTFGKIIIVIEDSSNKKCAKKDILYNEYIILKYLNEHPHENIIDIINLERIHISEKYLYNIIMPIYVNDLFEAIMTNQLPNNITNCVLQLLKGLEHLHHHKIAHRDIKPENILINKEGKLLYSDFGLAKICTIKFVSQTCGTEQYIAPEAEPNNLWDAFLADIWSLGITCYAILFKTFPNKHQVNKSIIMPEEITPEYKNLLENMLSTTPEKRLSPAKLQELAYFTK